MKQSFHEDRIVGLLLTFLGGAMDAYTYIHYNVFATAQTGNLILAVIEAFEGAWWSVFKKVLALTFFFAGIFVTKFLLDHFRKTGQHYWRLYILYYEAVIFFLIGFSPINLHPALVTVMIAFSASMQWVAFDKIDGKAYTNLFTTGNLKGVATNLYDYSKTKNQQDYENFMHYFRVVLAFILGAIASVALFHLVGMRSIWFVSGLFILLALYETVIVWRFYRNNPKLFK